MQKDELDEFDLLEPDEVEEFGLKVVRSSGRRQQLDKGQAELGERHPGRIFWAVKFLKNYWKNYVCFLEES